jgi:hypothetical protein
MQDKMLPIKIGQKPFRVTIYEQVNCIRWLTYVIVWYHPIYRVRGSITWRVRQIKKTKTIADKREATQFAKSIYLRLTALSQNGIV